MTDMPGPGRCACGEPATGRSRKRGNPRCVACSEIVMRRAVLEMASKSGPAYEAWQTSGGPQGFERARQSPRVHAARLANLAKARAANERRRAAEVTADCSQPELPPAPVAPPSVPRAVPAVVFRSPW